MLAIGTVVSTDWPLDDTVSDANVLPVSESYRVSVPSGVVESAVLMCAARSACGPLVARAESFSDESSVVAVAIAAVWTVCVHVAVAAVYFSSPL